MPTKKLVDLLAKYATKMSERDQTQMALLIDELVKPLGQELQDKTKKINWYQSNIKILLGLIGDRGVCKGCGEPFYWVKHRNGKNAPYTLDGLNHFANCRAADKFRKEKKGGR